MRRGYPTDTDKRWKTINGGGTTTALTNHRSVRLPVHLALLATLLIPERRERTCPRAVKRARHNSYRVKKPGEPASTRHRAPATIKGPPINNTPGYGVSGAGMRV
jgi:hypothetical protein